MLVCFDAWIALILGSIRYVKTMDCTSHVITSQGTSSKLLN